MTLMATSGNDNDLQLSTSSIVTVGISSGTNSPRSRARPVITTVRKSRFFCPPRVDEYVTDGIVCVCLLLLGLICFVVAFVVVDDDDVLLLDRKLICLACVRFGSEETIPSFRYLHTDRVECCGCCFWCCCAWKIRRDFVFWITLTVRFEICGRSLVVDCRS